MIIIRRTLILLKNYSQDKSGSIAILFSLSLMILLGLAGLAIDFARMNAATSLLSAALDAATLAAANSKDQTLSGRRAVANAVFQANLRSTMLGGLIAKSQFNVDGKRRVLLASASVMLPTSLPSVTRTKELSIMAKAEVVLSETTNTEIALVLDYSASMYTDNNYLKMRDVATHFVEGIAATTADNNAVKFGLVPFSGAVLVTLPGHAVIGGVPGRSWTKCVQDRQYPYNVTGQAVDHSMASKWGHSLATEMLYRYPPNCDNYRANDLELMPLTSDSRAILGKLRRMRPADSTHISAAFAFGYDLLNPNSIFGTAAPFGNTTHKFLILMTDGKQSTFAFGPGNRRTVADGEANLLSLCYLARSKGIKVATVAFMLDDPISVQRLKICASEPKLSFDVKNASALSAAFASISDYIRKQPYLSK